MKITYKGDYALKTILALALHYGNGPLTIHDIAKGADIPIKFLEHILLDLKRGSFVESKRGKIGGYLLAKSPSRIKLGEVIRFMDGPLEPVACVNNKYKGCNEINRCVFRSIWCQVTDLTSQIIDNITFEDLAKKKKSLNSTFIYHI